jgi:hypothetical protein
VGDQHWHQRDPEELDRAAGVGVAALNWEAGTGPRNA